MPMILDAHVHVYPCYDLARAFSILARRLTALAPGADAVGCLAERAGCAFFRDAVAGRVRANGWSVARVGPPEQPALRVDGAAGTCLHLVPGRQVAAAEGVEILALTADAAPPDGTPAREAVARILAAGGVPVLTWALGKWLGRRRAVVTALLAEFGPERLPVGDTSLRPRGWGEPTPMRRAAAQGRPILAGSDPLPCAGGERALGAYAARIDAALDPRDPTGSIRAALRSRAPCARVGRRGSWPAVLHRLLRYYASR